MSTVITWAGTASTAVSGMIVQKPNRGALGVPLDSEVVMAGRDGSWVFPDARGNRAISADCVIVGTPVGRRAAVQQLGAWLDWSGMQELYFSDEPNRYWLARLKSAPSVDEWTSTARFSLLWSAEPYAYSASLSSQCVTAVGGSDTGSFVVPDSVGANPVVEITPLDGTLTSFTLTVNGYVLVVTGITIPAGSTITVSSYSYTITGGQNGEAELNGAYDATPNWSLDASGEFPLLVSGTNTWGLDWTGTATNTEVCFRWRERSY